MNVDVKIELSSTSPAQYVSVAHRQAENLTGCQNDAQLFHLSQCSHAHPIIHPQHFVMYTDGSSLIVSVELKNTV